MLGNIMLLYIYQFVDSYFWWVFATITYYLILKPNITTILNYKLQELKTEWLCFARVNHMDMNGEIYQKIDTILERNIALQKKSTLIKYYRLLVLFHQDKEKVKSLEDFFEKVDRLDATSKEKIDDISAQLDRVIFKTIWVRSPIVTSLFTIMALMVLLMRYLSTNIKVPTTQARLFGMQKVSVHAVLLLTIFSFSNSSYAGGKRPLDSHINPEQETRIMFDI